MLLKSFCWGNVYTCDDINTSIFFKILPTTQNKQTQCHHIKILKQFKRIYRPIRFCRRFFQIKQQHILRTSVLNINVGFAVYGFHVSSFKPIHDYLFHRRSILSPLLFNIHLCDLFYFLEDLDIASHSDYTTIYTVNKKESVITVFESSSTQLFGSFNNNFMKASNGKKKVS